MRLASKFVARTGATRTFFHTSAPASAVISSPTTLALGRATHPSQRHSYMHHCGNQVLDFRGSEVNGHGPLAGIRVVELGSFVAGPHCGTLLSYFGAEVIKVEPPGGDQLQKLRVVDDSGTSYWWRSAARNKKCVTMNLKNEGAQDLVKKLEIEHEALSKAHQTLIYKAHQTLTHKAHQTLS